MHYAKHGSRSPSLDDSTHEGLEKQPRLKTADLGFHAPEHVLDDTIPITDPKLIYSNVYAQRDRRLRLLIRRYTNQIQYGCRNVNCSTPTCLSYRKRNRTAPLRKYTELSARTLACQLVDEYTRSSKEPALGLCQHEPVVPWYEDPALAKKRRNSHEKLPQQRQENGHLPKPVAQHQRTRESSRQLPMRDITSRRSSQDGVVEAGRRPRDIDASVANGIADILNTVTPLQSHDRDRPSKLPTSSEPLQARTDLEKPKDLTSFTQTLFDLVPLRLLNWLPARRDSATRDWVEPLHHPLDEEKPSAAQASDTATMKEVSSDEPSGPEPSTRPPESTPIQDRPTYSLKTLTWPNLLWLSSPAREEDPGYHANFIPFIRQSFAYCLGDPQRLVMTMKDIQDSYSPATRQTAEQEAIATGGDKKSTMLIESPSPWPVILTKTKDDMKAVLHGLALFEDLDQRDLVMTSVLNALRNSYDLPPWLRNRGSGKRSRSGSATNSDGALTKRQQALDAANACASQSLNTPELDLFHEIDLSAVQLQDSQITELCLATLLLLAATIFNRLRSSARGDQQWTDKHDFIAFSRERDRGLAYGRSPRPFSLRSHLKSARPMIEAIDVFEDWSVHQLLSVLMDVISHRLTVAKWANTLKPSKGTMSKKETIVDSLVARFDRDFLPYFDSDGKTSWIGHAAIELARTVLLKNWDRSAIVQRAGPVGGALELLAGVYRERQGLDLQPGDFWMPFIAESFDDMTMPSQWLSFHTDNRQMHILSFSFLFRPEVLVRYFRAINIAIMKKSHEDASLVYNDTRQYVWTTNPNPIPLHGVREVLAHLRPHMAKYFVLTIRRDDLLNNAINQLWRRQRRELLRPLRVRIGKDEGEDGLDHGGVQQEFFRLSFAEAFRPDYGMFTVDDTTRMAWFQPGSFEPLYRFEALGILMSLAIYNGITLPITMPLAFYRKLLGFKVKKLNHISDGWPDLAAGLMIMLEWSDGDVGDVIARTYEFAYELCGSKVSVDMQKVGRNDPWPPSKAKPSKKGKEKSKSTTFELPLEPTLTPPSRPSPSLSPTVPTAPILSRTSSIDIKGISTPQSIESEMLENYSTDEASLVTNANRSQYVKDYILWLTHKSIEPQYEAFARGFYTCLDRTALSIFTPESLQALVEGSTEIDIDALEQTTTYDEYTASDPTIIDFWQIVRNMSAEQHKRLLEFVTASDRVPVNGMSSITFTVQKNGEEDSRLPSSSTCYGRLLLPQYSSREVLEEKLTKAIENSVGFGTL